MYKIKIFSIGKNKETFLQDAISEYTKRLKSIMLIEWFFAKNNQQLQSLLSKEESFYALDPSGRLFSSENFSKFFMESLENEGSRLQLVIGGAEGIPQDIKSRSKILLSLSPMTFTHQLTRLILIEQIYRAYEIFTGSCYHK